MPVNQCLCPARPLSGLCCLKAGVSPGCLACPRGCSGKPPHPGTGRVPRVGQAGSQQQVREDSRAGLAQGGSPGHMA